MAGFYAYSESQQRSLTPIEAAGSNTLRTSLEFQRLLMLSEDELPETPWVRKGLRALSQGTDHLAELNAHSMTDTTWDGWESLTHSAAAKDARKDWPLGDTEYYSPRGQRTFQRLDYLWDALPKQRDIGMRVRKGKTTLTLHHLLELIHKVCASKEELDRRYSSTPVPKQTLKQHMHGWVDKASLQSGADPHTVLERVNHAILHYKPLSNEVAVFAAILANDVGEDMRHVQRHLEMRIRQLVKQCVELLEPSTQVHREKLLKQRLEGMVHQDEWWEILTVLYNDKDADIVKGRCHKVMRAYAPPRKRVGPISVPNPDAHPGYIKFPDFVKVCLDFQLEVQQRYLKRLAQLFRHYDRANTGLLSGMEFSRLAQVLSPDISNQVIASYLDMVDPCAIDQVSLSDIINCLHKEIREWLSQCKSDAAFTGALQFLSKR